jgi:hypothetical protein
MSTHDKIQHDVSQNLADDETAKNLSSKSNDGDIANYLSIEPNGKFHPCLQKLFFDDYTDKNYLKTIPQIRALRDKVTDAYVSAFLQNPNNTYQIMDFVNWMYQYVNFVIVSNINKKLTSAKYDNDKQSQKTDQKPVAMAPLNYAETVKLIFKGGTTMHVIYNQALTGIDHEISLAISENNEAKADELRAAYEVLKSMADNFKVSDTDMCIDISAGDNRRYLSITYATSQLIIKAMEGISNDLEHLFFKGCGMKPRNELSSIATMTKPPGYDDAKAHKGITEKTNADTDGVPHTGNYNTNVLENLMVEIKHAKALYFNISKVYHYSRLWDTLKIDKFADITVDGIPVKGVHSVIREYALDNEGTIRGSKNPMIASLLIELIDFYLYHSANEYAITNNENWYGEDSEFYMKYIILRDILELFAKYSIHILYDKIKGIYSPDNITKFKTDAAANLTDLAKDLTGDLLYDPTKSNYSLLVKSEFTNKDISTSKDIAYRKDIVTHSNDNPIYSTRSVACTRYNINESSKTEGEHLHYISMNNTIVDFFSSNKLDFMLFRIKLNTVVKDIIRPVTIRKTAENLQGKFIPKFLAKVDGEDIKGKKIYKYKSEADMLNIISYRDVTKDEDAEIKEFKTPSEVLDITINDKFDTQKLRKGHHYTYMHHRVKEAEGSNEVHSHILTYSSHMHVNDISYILYEQGHFLAWMDNKYKKRISRLFFFMGIYQQEVQNLEENSTNPKKDLYKISEILCSGDDTQINLFNLIKNLDISDAGIAGHKNRELINSVLDKYTMLGSKSLTPEYIYKISNQYPIYMIIQYHKEIENFKDVFDSIVLMHSILYFMTDEQALNILANTYESIHNIYDRTTLLEQTRRDYRKYIEDLKDIVISAKTNTGMETIFTQDYYKPLLQTITSAKTVSGHQA